MSLIFVTLSEVFFATIASTDLEMSAFGDTLSFMGLKHRLHHLIVTAFFVLVWYSIPSHAQDSAETLLESLKSATPQDALRIDSTLRSEWSKSGSAAMDLLLRRGRKALDEDNLDAAIEHFTALTDHAPEFAEGWHGLARAYFEAELYGPTLDALGHAIALNPNHYHAIFGLGALFQQFDDYVRAEQAYRQVLELNPNHEQAKEALERLKRQGIGRTL